MAEPAETTSLYDKSFRDIVKDGLGEIGDLTRKDTSRGGSSNSAGHFKREILQALTDRTAPFCKPGDTKGFCSIVDTAFRSHFHGKESTSFVKQIGGIIEACRSRIVAINTENNKNDGSDAESLLKTERSKVFERWDIFRGTLKPFISKITDGDDAYIERFINENIFLFVDNYIDEVFPKAINIEGLHEVELELFELLKTEFGKLKAVINPKDIEGLRNILFLLKTLKKLIGTADKSLEPAIDTLIGDYMRLNSDLDDDTGEDTENDNSSAIKLDRIVETGKSQRCKERLQRTLDPVPVKDYPQLHHVVRFLTGALMEAVNEIINYIYSSDDLPFNPEIKELLDGSKGIYVTTIQSTLVENIARIVGRVRNPAGIAPLDGRTLIQELYSHNDFLHVVILIFSAMTGVKAYPSKGAHCSYDTVQDRLRELGPSVQDSIKTLCVDRYSAELPSDGAKPFKWKDIQRCIIGTIKFIEGLPARDGVTPDDEDEVDLDANLSNADFSDDELDYIRDACEEFFRAKPNYQPESLNEFISSLTRDLNVAIHQGQDIRKAEQVRGKAEAVLDGLKLKATGTDVLLANVPVGAPSPKINFIETLPEAERRAIADNQEWMKQIMALHPRESKLESDKRLIYAMWHFYCPENIIHLSLNHVRFFSRIIAVFRHFGKTKSKPKKANETFLSLESLRIENLIEVLGQFMESSQGVLSANPDMNALNDVMMSNAQTVEEINKRLGETRGELENLVRIMRDEDTWETETSELDRAIGEAVAEVQKLAGKMPDVMAAEFSEWQKAVDKARRDIARKQAELKDRRESHTVLDREDVSRKKVALEEESKSLTERKEKAAGIVERIQTEVKGLLESVITPQTE